MNECQKRSHGCLFRFSFFFKSRFQLNTSSFDSFCSVYSPQFYLRRPIISNISYECNYSQFSNKTRDTYQRCNFFNFLVTFAILKRTKKKNLNLSWKQLTLFAGVIIWIARIIGLLVKQGLIWKAI